MIRFYNGKVLNISEKTDEPISVSEEELWVDGDKIVYKGNPSKEELDAKKFDREINLDGNLLMPGFKDAHTHTAMTFLRSYADDLPLQEWLYDKVFPHEGKLTAESIVPFTKLGIMEYLTSGITASFDMYFFLDNYVQANIDCGFRTVLCGAMNDFDKDYTQLERDFEKFNGMHPLISHRIGFHAEYTTCMERMEYVASLAKKYKAPVYMHNSETKAEVEGCKERYNKTPMQLLSDLGMFEYGGGGFHCVHVTDEDMDIMKAKNVWAITNPCSNAKLASGIAPIDKFMKKGVGLAIGTDGAASNNALDMFREMYLVSVLQKLSLEDAAAVDGAEVLKMACVGGAKAMGLDDCTNLEVGKQADLVVIDLHRPNMQPILNIPKNIVYSGSKENVKLTMIAGKVLYENGEFFIGEDPEKIYADAAMHAKNIFAQVQC